MLYRVTYDSKDYYVMARNFGNAVVGWREHIVEEKIGPWDAQPDIVELLHDGPVISSYGTK